MRLKFEAVLTALALALANGVVMPAAARADDGHNHAGHHHAEIIAFRLIKWKEMHFDDATDIE